MSHIPLSVLAKASGTIMVHVDAGDAGRFGLDIDAGRLPAELDAFEATFNVDHEDRVDRAGHEHVMRKMLDACRTARKLGPEIQDAFDETVVLGVVWDVVNDPEEGAAARSAILERLTSGRPAHLRARPDRSGGLRCRVLRGEPGGRDDLEWTRSAA